MFHGTRPPYEKKCVCNMTFPIVCHSHKDLDLRQLSQLSLASMACSGTTWGTGQAANQIGGADTICETDT